MSNLLASIALGIIVGVLIAFAWASIDTMNYAKTLTEKGYTVIEVSKLETGTLIDVPTIDSLMQKAAELNTTTIYQDTIWFNGIVFVVTNGTIGYNFKF
jgi:hypothetical protein